MNNSQIAPIKATVDGSGTTTSLKVTLYRRIWEPASVVSSPKTMALAVSYGAGSGREPV